MTCRSGCQTQDHATYGECCASIHILVGAEHARARAWDSNLADYRDTRAQGIQPASTRQRDIEAAVALSQLQDKAFDATDGSFRG